MNAKQFEATVVKTWVETNIPLTHANLTAVTGEARSDVEHHMRGLLRQGVVDMDVGADGEIEWKVRGAKRPRAAPDTVGDVKEKQQATQNLAEAKAVIAVAGKSAIKALEPGPGQKGVLLSAGLSLLFGPFGWLYSGA